MNDLVNEVLNRINAFDDLYRNLKRMGYRKAETERAYKIAHRKKVLELRDAGQPVTIIHDLSHGDPAIAELRLQRDLAVTEYEAAQEKINLEKLAVRILEAQVAREWGRNA